MTASNGTGDADALREDIRQTRADLGQTVQALAAKADVKSRVREQAVQKKEHLREQAMQQKERARGTVVRAAGVARGSARKAGGAARRNPAPFVVAAGAGAVVLALLAIRRRRR